MNILITGAKGYIGSTLVDYLGHKAIPFESRNRVPKVDEFVKILNGLDVVINLAGGGGNKRCHENPQKAIADNILFTNNLILAAKEQIISQFIFISTIAVYTSFAERENPFNEDMVAEPDDFYGSIKWCCEEMVKCVPYTILRLANVYGYGSGKNLQSGGFINNVCLDIKQSKVITINNESIAMDFVSVNDVVKAIKNAILNEHAINQIINVGSGFCMPIIRIAEMIKNLSKNNIEIKVGNEKVFSNRYLDNAKAKKILNWQPEQNLTIEILQLLHTNDTKRKAVHT